jgi:hypothetical protein
MKNALFVMATAWVIGLRLEIGIGESAKKNFLGIKPKYKKIEN